MSSDLTAQEVLHDVETGALEEMERAPVDHGHGRPEELRRKLLFAKGQNRGQKTM